MARRSLVPVRRAAAAALVVAGIVLLPGGAADAAIAYVDLARQTTPPPGRFVANLPGNGGATSASLLDYTTGTAMGTISIPSGSATSFLFSSATGGWGAAGDPVYDHFQGFVENTDGSGYRTGTSPPLVFTLSGLDESLTYILTVGVHRDSNAGNPNRYTLGGADAFSNTSSPGATTADGGLSTVLSRSSPFIAQWSGVAPGDDGTITLTWAPDVIPVNFYYIGALSLEAVPEPATLGLLACGTLGLLGRRTRRFAMD